jgi:hypothetical protein
MSLPIPWVDKIFQKLTLTYGRDFLNRWEGVPIEDVKEDWAHELRGFQQNPSAIAYGLQNCLNGKPPTVHDFKAICIRRPETVLTLPEPFANPEKVAAELKKLESVKLIQRTDHRAWAKNLKKRHDSGEKINMNQVRCYREALGITA